MAKKVLKYTEEEFVTLLENIVKRVKKEERLEESRKNEKKDRLEESKKRIRKSRSLNESRGPKKSIGTSPRRRRK
ncbi:hypothetical protein N9966_00665 [bacterium]|nr:hypothetical protein [bacterium]